MLSEKTAKDQSISARPGSNDGRELSPGKHDVRINANSENILHGISREDLEIQVKDFCNAHGLTDCLPTMIKGAFAAQHAKSYHELEILDDEDKAVLDHERSNKWDQPWMLYYLCVMVSFAAATQGMDETVNNGAVAIYPDLLGITEEALGSAQKVDYITGLVVSAPYLACAVLGCWLTQPLNNYLGRRGTIFLSCTIAAIASIWEAVVQSWPNLFVARFVLGLGIGSKSSTVPVYTAECAPAPIRGALVMQWQVWTAFGIMLGNIMGVAFGGLRPDLAWRLILGSTVVLPLIVCFQVYACPESPRWLIEKGRIKEALESFRKLRTTELQACRDTFYTYKGVKMHERLTAGKNLFTMFYDLFKVARNARATLASWIVMFGQQFCAVNVIAYYSTNIFIDGGYSLNQALLVSMGTGILNWAFALPAFLTIDKFGRRPLLIFTLPCLGICLLWSGMSFFITEDLTRTAMITTGLYLFECFYSPGMGPVPFSYSAEAFPMHVRDVGMSWATATTWCFNFIIAFTFPSLASAFTPQGAFGWYAAWCFILWILVILFVPETKQLTLEELDHVFSIPTWQFASYQIKQSVWWTKKNLLRRRMEPLPTMEQIGQQRANEKA